MITEIHIGDIGTVFDLTIKDQNRRIVDISNPISLKVKLKPPGLATLVRDGVLTNDGTDGRMKYVSGAEDLIKTGEWKIQGFVELDTGKWSSNIEIFQVLSNL